VKEVFALLETNGIASLCVLIAIYIVFRVFEFVFRFSQEKQKLSDESVKLLTSELHALREQIGKLESTLAEFPKFKLDVRRLFFALKSMAGDRWGEIREEMMKETDFLER
jgi:hypothetical protein